MGLGSDIQSSSEDSAGGERASDPGLPPGRPGGAPGEPGWGVRWEAVPLQAVGREGHVHVGGGAKGRGGVRKGLGGARSGAKSKSREWRGRG